MDKPNTNASRYFMPKFLVTITETNTRSAVVSAKSKREARSKAEAAWNDPNRGYDSFHDDQDVGHHVSDVVEASIEDARLYPDLEA